MKTIRTKILFLSVLFSAAVPSVLFSSEEQPVTQKLMIQKELLPTLSRALNEKNAVNLRELVSKKIEIGDLVKSGYQELSFHLFGQC